MELSALLPMLVDQDSAVFEQALELLLAADDPSLWQALMVQFAPARWARLPPQPPWFRAIRSDERQRHRASWLLLHAPEIPASVRVHLSSLYLQGFPRFDAARHKHILRPRSLERLRHFPDVRHIELTYLDCPDSAAALAHCTGLEKLLVFQCRLPDGLRALDGHPTLETLTLSTLEQMRPLPRLPALKQLDMLGLPLSILGAADSHTVVLRHPPDSDLSALAGKQTQRFRESMPKYDDLRTLPAGLPLRVLGLAGGWLRSLDGIEALQALEWLSLQGNRLPLDIAPLAALTALRGVDLRRCEGVTDLSPLRDLPALERIQLFEQQADQLYIPNDLRDRVQREPDREYWNGKDDWENWSPTSQKPQTA